LVIGIDPAAGFHYARPAATRRDVRFASGEMSHATLPLRYAFPLLAAAGR